jgi:TolB-like protein
MRVQFGPFELDTDRGRLLKHGIPVRIREQPLRVLVALIERPGEIVAREDLRRRLWSDGTFVDFEVGLNSAISRPRRVLNDDVDAPHLIETVPKRGYRFIGSVPRQHLLAIMPFTTQPTDSENEYFSEGLTEELIRELSRIEDLRVVAPSVVSRYRNQTYDLKQVRKELGVNAVLQGSVRRISGTVRINVHLVNTADGFELWSDRFDGEWKDVFTIQDRESEGVALALKLRLVAKPPGGPSNPEAYNCYLRGHHLMKRHTPSNLQRGLEYLQEAIRLDPAYALPYHGVALYHILGALMGDLAPRGALPQTEELLFKGLALAGESSMLQNTLAILRMFQWRWRDAQESFQRAINQEPGNPYPHLMFALLCTFLGRHEQALQEARQALQLDPLDPLANFRMVQCLYYARQYEEAVQSSHTAIELSRDFPYTHWYAAWSLAALGREAEAWNVATGARRQTGLQPFNLGQLGYLAGMLGHTAEALAVLSELKDRRDHSYSPALPIAWAYLGMGDSKRCLDWLETALAECEPYLASVAVFPGYDALRNNSRFQRVADHIRAENRNAILHRSEIVLFPGCTSGH